MKDYSKYEIIRFHYCRGCGILSDGKHASPHFRSNERHGFIVLHYPPRNQVYVAPTFSSAGSIETCFDLELRTFSSGLGWLWYGSTREFYDIAAGMKDMDIPIRKIMAEDYNFKEIRELYRQYVNWYTIYIKLKE